MAMLEQVVRLDMKPQKNPPHVDCTQYDSGSDGWLIRAYLFNNGSKFVIPTGYTAKIEGTTKENTGFTFAATNIDNANGVVTFALTDDATAFKGSAWCKIVFEKGSSRIATSGFWLDNDRAGVEADTVIGAPGFEAQIVDAVQDWLDEHPPAVGGMSEAFKQALLDCFENVAWINDDGQTYYDALYAALYPPVDVLSISAVFTQGDNVIYDTDSLDTLKQYLVVTATMMDSTTQTVTDYTLSGTLAAGTSVITVSYGGKTTTFNVTVTEHLATLDDVAYGSLTYRDIFITNNLISYLGDFETSGLTFPSTYTQVPNKPQDEYKINAGSPTLSTDNSNTTSHSLKAFGSGSNQLVYTSTNGGTANTKYLVACAVTVSRYSAGKCGIQGGSPITNATSRFNIGVERTTSGWEYITDLFTMPASDYYAYVGSWSSANLDGYVDDVVVSPVPSGMTAEEAQTLYEEYIAIRKRGET